MINHRVKWTRVRAFLKLAREEFSVAQLIELAQRRQSAYFLQQATEKLLRGVLEIEDSPAGPTHNIQFLADQLPNEHPFKKRFLELDVLSPAATRFRYPTSKGELADIDPVKLRDLVSRVENLLADVGSYLEACLKQAEATGR